MDQHVSGRPGDVHAVSPARSKTWALLVAITLLGGLARLWNLNWDGGAYSLHSDEWALNQVVRNLGPDLNPHFFFYGSLPIYLYRATAEVLSILTGVDWLAQERVALVGRAYSALASIALIPMIFAIGRRLWGEGVGIIAASCAAGTALLIQAAHFGTVDTLLTLEGAAILWVSLLIISEKRASLYVLAGLLIGLSLATKLTAGAFILLPLLAHLGHVGRPVQGNPTTKRGGWAYSLLRLPLLMFVVGAGTMLLASPYYLLAWDELWAAVRVQTEELSGGYELPYTWQFIGSTPYMFEMRNLIVWGLGLPLGIAAVLGWGWYLLRLARDRTLPLLVLTVWPILYLLYIGTWEARFIRHTLPLVPFCCLFAAGGLVALMHWLQRFGVRGRWLGRGLVAVVVAGTALWGLAFLSIYTSPDTRLETTEWIHTNLAPGTRLVVEDKNQLLPLPSSTHPVDTYRYEVLKVTAPDTQSKMDDFAGALADGDVLVLANRRWSSVLPRHSDFPLTSRYYRLLFTGELGYEPLVTFASSPRLGPFVWNDDDAEETFQVFDHPIVRLFRNTRRLPEAELRRLLALP